MTEEHFIRAHPLECRLVSCVMEIDDDDDDVIQVSIDVSNEAAMPIGGLDIFIQTSDNRKVESMEGISSLGPGLTRRFTFEFPLQTGDWTFMLRSPSVKADLGPYEADFTFQAGKGRVYNNAIGSGMFNDAFTSDLEDFGNTEERGIIDSSSIKMTSYFGENSVGGSTAISVGNAPVEDAAPADEPRIPPWEKAPDLLLSTPVTSSQEPVTEDAPPPAADLLAFSKQVSQPKTEPNEVPITAATPPPLPPEAVKPATTSEEISSESPIAPPSSPPTSLPTRTSTEPPRKPPSSPPKSPPTSSRSGPPRKPPSSPPSSPPANPPTGPPKKAQSSPPKGPPKGPPGKPPTGPPPIPPTSEKPTKPQA